MSKYIADRHTIDSLNICSMSKTNDFFYSFQQQFWHKAKVEPTSRYVSCGLLDQKNMIAIFNQSIFIIQMVQDQLSKWLYKWIQRKPCTYSGKYEVFLLSFECEAIVLWPKIIFFSMILKAMKCLPALLIE